LNVKSFNFELYLKVDKNAKIIYFYSSTISLGPCPFTTYSRRNFMYEHWTEDAKLVVKKAEAVARRFNSEDIDTSHLFLGFLEVTKEMEFWQLFWRNFKLNPDNIYSLVGGEYTLKNPRPTKKRTLDLTPMLKKVIESLAPRKTICVTLNDLFLRILEEKDCLMSGFLEERGVSHGIAEATLKRIS